MGHKNVTLKAYAVPGMNAVNTLSHIILPRVPISSDYINTAFYISP